MLPPLPFVTTEGELEGAVPLAVPEAEAVAPLPAVTTEDEVEGAIPLAVPEAEAVTPLPAVDSGGFWSASAFAAVTLRLSSRVTSR